MKHGSTKARFVTWIIRNEVNVFSLFLLNNTDGLPVLRMNTKCPNQLLYVLNIGWKRDCFQVTILVYVFSTWIIVELKNHFEMWLTRNDVNGVSLFHFSYIITLMAYLCAQRTPKVQVKYFIFDCSIYRLFVPNTGWKFDSLQMMIFVNVCSTLSVVELKTR
jgi:hypothetical protein